MKNKLIVIIALCLCMFLTSCKLFHKHDYIDYRCECGKTQAVTVTLVNNNQTSEIKVKYGTKIDIYNYEEFQVLDESFFGWFIGNKKFDFNNSILFPITLHAKYKENHTVIFKDFDGTVISTQEVMSGNKAIAPEVPFRMFYEFTGWDKDFSFVSENLEITAQYKPSNMEFNIEYVIDDKYKDYQTKDEMILDFLYDFYEFVNPTESLKSFIYGVYDDEGTWVNYIGGSEGAYNYLIYNNDINANNDEYFLNSSKYKEKWYCLAEYVKVKICAGNKRFGYPDVTYSYGALDFKRYITNNPSSYISSYGGESVFYGYPKTEFTYETKYKYTSDDVLLPITKSLYFEGWYLDENYTDGPYTLLETGSVGHKTFYAKINTDLTHTISFNTNIDVQIEDMIVRKNDNIILPVLEKDGLIFDGWYLDYVFVENDFIYNFDCSINLVAKWIDHNNINYDYLQYNGKNITYRNSVVPVELPDQYIEKEEELRACWVSSFTNSFEPSTNKEEMMKELTTVLDFMESYNMNCMIFHIRTHNNAFYKTQLAPISSEYGTYESFAEWDYLEWLIEECHKRNIEFHAWLNPYRIEQYGISNDLSVKDATKKIADEYAMYPENPASNRYNILLTYDNEASRGAILNPALEEVQDYITKVCMEVVENYDVDAIHFDDYFYAKLSESNNILEDPDQEDYDFYINNNNERNFKLNSVSDKEAWRRMNVDNLIKKIHTSLTDYNKTNSKNVKFGISPTGVYKSGDGSVESGSNTTTPGHYAGKLFCDTVKWINENWIDYIMPQCYYSFDCINNSFHEMASWWNKVVEGTNVSLYIGIGLHNSISGTYEYSWAKEENELINQLLYLNMLKNVKGVSLFSFTSMMNIYNDLNSISHNAFIKLKNEMWLHKVKVAK